MEFRNEEDLRKLLVSAGINVSGWGHGPTKSVRDLWFEIREGIATIDKEPLLRKLSVTQVKIQHGRRILIEVEQELQDGRKRQRNSLPAEKMRPGESCVSATTRCLSEEIGVDPQKVEILSSSKNPRRVRADSSSYPGLSTQYTIYTVHAKVTGLPETDFWTDEQNNAEGDPVRRHRWKWCSELESFSGFVGQNGLEKV